MSLIRWLRRKVSVWSMITGLVGAVAVHVIWTLSAPGRTEATPVAILAGSLDVNRMHVVARGHATSQPLPFLGRHARWAVCPFDLLQASHLVVRTDLAGAEAMVTLLADNGAIFHTQAGKADRATRLALSVVPPRQQSWAAWLQGRAYSIDPSRVQSPSMRGLIVVSAPVEGASFEADAEASLQRASCRLVID